MNLLIPRCLAGLLLAFVFVLTGCNGASEIARNGLNASSDHGFLTRTLHRGMWTRKYAIFVPKSYHAGITQKYPVIIFLHGIGEGDGLGEGNLKNLTVGLGPAVARKADTFDFIVIFPQSDGSWSPNSGYTQDIFTALATTAREYPVDLDRVYLTGLSTGGYGTWAIGAKFHDQFAAIVPMGSNGDDQGDADNLTHVPVRAYCSVFGDMFAGFNDRGMVHKIKELNPDADAKFTPTPTLGHDCWESVYGGEELYTWLKQQRRSGAAVGPGANPSPAVAQASAAPTSTYQPVPQPAAPPVAQPAAHSVPVFAPAPRPAPVAPQPVQTAVPAAPKASTPAPHTGDWVNTPW